MEIVDIILGALLAYGFYKGWKNGLFVELASIIAFFVGIFVAIKFSYIVSGFLSKSLHWSPKTIQVFAFVLTLIFVIIAIHLLAKVFTKMASFAFLGWLNTLGGAVFGTLKTVLLLGILLALVQKVNVNNILISKEKQDKSVFFNPILKTSSFMLPFLTTWFNDLKGKVK